jgi:hypothetical protein
MFSDEEEEEEFSWTEEEVADLYDNTSVIIAADGKSLIECSIVLL